MPYITFRTIEGLAKPELKAKLIARISDVVADIEVEFLGANKEKVLSRLWCIVEEIPFDNFGVGGVPLTIGRTKEIVGAKRGPFKDE